MLIEIGKERFSTKHLHGIFEFRLEYDRKEIESVLGELKEVALYILSHWSKYDIDFGIYGDLRAKYEELMKSL